MLTSEVRNTLVNVDTVIIDEIHAMATTKRGAHLMLSLERLEADHQAAAAAHRPHRHAAPAGGGRPLPRRPRADGGRPRRPVTIVDSGIRKPLEVDVVVPVEDMGDLGQAVDASCAAARPPRRCSPQRSSIWPSIYPRILQQVLEHRSTIIFCNAPPLRPSGWPRGSTSSPPTKASSRPAAAGRSGEGAPRLAGPRAAGGHRGRAEARRAARHRRHQQPRAGHRHGCGRPGHPGRVAGRGVAAGCSASAAPATGWASPARARCTPSTAATCSRPRWWCAACSTA